MAFVFKPGLWRASSTSPPSVGEVVGSGRMFWLPAPIYNFPVSVEWKGRIVETRLADGAEGVRGNKKKARTESFSGKIAKTTRDGTVLYTDEDMYGWFEDFTDFLTFGNTTAERDKSLELFWFYDSASSTYRKHKSVYAASLRTDIGDTDRVVFPWNLQLTIADPVIYTTSPGA